MRPNPGDWDTELMELALATERLAGIVADPMVAARLREIAADVRTMAQHGSDAPGACWLSV